MSYLLWYFFHTTHFDMFYYYSQERLVRPKIYIPNDILINKPFHLISFRQDYFGIGSISAID